MPQANRSILTWEGPTASLVQPPRNHTQTHTHTKRFPHTPPNITVHNSLPWTPREPQPAGTETLPVSTFEDNGSDSGLWGT